MEDNDDGRCMHGCYPCDIDTIREKARTEGPGDAQEWIDDNQPNGQPYVGATDDGGHQRKIKVSAGNQGVPVDAYMSVLHVLETEQDYEAKKTAEWLHANPGSQIHQELMQRRQQAEQQINSTLASLSDLYEQKHLLEHDIRKLEQKNEHFTGDQEEALKADFVDEVDQHTGRSSILQMQANDIFPSITADFYSMESLEDLTDGHLSSLPEQEKAILRKKWKLYQKWKEKYGQAIGGKLKDIKKRLRSVETSIKQTETWLKPYVQTIQQMEGDPEAEIEEMTDPYMLEGYSSQVRKMKVIFHDPILYGENDNGEEIVTHRDVIVFNIFHVSLGGSEQPQAPGQGGEVVAMEWKGYTVCEHVFNEVFKPQIEKRENEVKRYIKEYSGEEVEPDLQLHTEREFEPYQQSFFEKLKIQIYRWLGIGDEYFHLEDEIDELSEPFVSSEFASPFYKSFKYTVGLYVMK